MSYRISALLTVPAAFFGFASPTLAGEFDGPFVGAAAGYSRDEVGPEIPDNLPLADETDRDAAYFQIFAGYDYAIAPKVRIGLEAGLGIGADDELRLSDVAGSAELDPEYTFEITARAGYLVHDSILVYARGGYQNARIETTLTTAGQMTLRDKESQDGWIAGGGVEYAWGNNLRSRVEYRYADLGSDGADWDRHQILAGVVWNF